MLNLKGFGFAPQLAVGILTPLPLEYLVGRWVGAQKNNLNLNINLNPKPLLHRILVIRGRCVVGRLAVPHSSCV